MSHKTFTRLSVLTVFMLVFFAIPVSAQAGGVCGSTYSVQQGDTLGSVASTCGVTVYDLYNANPSVSGYVLYAGQVLTIPNGDSSSDYNDQSNNGSYNGAQNNYNYTYPSGNSATNYYNYTCPSGNCAPDNYDGTYYDGRYVVKFGDTLSDIANRFGISLNDLWRANPNIEDANRLYPGTLINIPPPTYATPVPASPWYGPQYASQPPASQWYGSQYAHQPPASQWYGSDPYSAGYGSYSYPRSYRYGYVATPTAVPTPLSYGTVSAGSPMANIQLSNKANADVYVSLQGTARDGTNIVREYPVSGTFSKTIPAGYYDYIAYVGGREFSGAINMPGGSSHSITFHSNEVDVK